MSIPGPLNHEKPNARVFAPRFTPQTPFHHPHLDPSIPEENLPLVPPALFAEGTLRRELPKSATVNLHIVLKLPNDPEGLQKEFHDRIPQIERVLELWGEKKRADLSSTGGARLRSYDDERMFATAEGTETIFNLLSSLDTPGRSDIIFLADAAKDNGNQGRDVSIPSKVDWSGFDGSYVHLEDAEPKKTACPVEQDFDTDKLNRRDSTPFNLRTTEWPDHDEDTDPSGDVYSSDALI